MPEEKRKAGKNSKMIDKKWNHAWFEKKNLYYFIHYSKIMWYTVCIYGESCLFVRVRLATAGRRSLFVRAQNQEWLILRNSKKVSIHWLRKR